MCKRDKQNIECSESKKGSGVPGRARPHEALKVTVERKRVGAISSRFYTDPDRI